MKKGEKERESQKQMLLRYKETLNMYRRICKIALFTLARFIVISEELIARLTYFSLQMTYFPSRKCGQFGISERKKNLSLYLCHFILSTTAIVQYFDFKYE